MGFSLKKMFSGSGWKKFKKIAGGVVSVASLAVPGLGVAGVAGRLLAAKGAVGKVSRLTNDVLKINRAVKGGRVIGKGLARSITSTAAVLKASPVMPGGGVATPGGVMPPMVNPPANYGGRRSSSSTRKRKPKKRLAARKRSSSSRKRKGRKLKFGSPAYRKKYLGHR